MEMPTKQEKQQLCCLGLMFLLVFAILSLLSSCTTLSKFLQPHPETFDLTIGTETYTVILPQDFPDMKDAEFGSEMCWNTLICYKTFCVSKEKLHDHVHFWYVPGEAPSALVWVKEQETDFSKKYKFWIYMEDVPFAVDLQRINDFLQEKLIPRKGGEITWNQF